MKIAILVFGIPRASAVTHAPLLLQVVAPARALGQVGLFGHFFQQTHVLNPRSGEDASLGADNYTAFDDFDLRLEPPGACLTATDWPAIQAFGDYYQDGFRSLSNLLHQLHSIKAATELAMSSMAPDVFIFVRPDLLYHDPCPAAAIGSAARRPRQCHLPAWQWWGGYNDRLAICGREAGLAWGRRLDQALRYCQTQQKPLHAEKLLRFALKEQRTALRLLPVRASRVRVSGEVKEEIFAPLTTYSSRKGLLEMGRAWALTRLGV